MADAVHLSICLAFFVIPLPFVISCHLGNIFLCSWGAVQSFISEDLFQFICKYYLAFLSCKVKVLNRKCLLLTLKIKFLLLFWLLLLSLRNQQCCKQHIASTRSVFFYLLQRMFSCLLISVLENKFDFISFYDMIIGLSISHNWYILSIKEFSKVIQILPRFMQCPFGDSN